MRYLIPLLILVSGCSKPPECMKPNEYGEVVSVSYVQDQYCSAYRCVDTSLTTVLVRMPNGVSRVCSIQGYPKDSLKIGEKVNLSLMKKVF